MPINFESAYNHIMRFTFDNGYTIAIEMNVPDTVERVLYPSIKRDYSLMPKDAPSVTYADTATIHIRHLEDPSVEETLNGLTPEHVAYLLGQAAKWPGSVGYEKFENQSNINQ